MPTCGPPLILLADMKRWGPSGQQGLCSHLGRLWATFGSIGRCEASGTPPGGRGYVATLATCGPPLILSPAPKRWGPPRRQGLSSHLAHLRATFDSIPLLRSGRDPPRGRRYVATWPTCAPPQILSPAPKRWRSPRRHGLATVFPFGPPVIMSPALKRWEPPRRQGSCSHLAHLWPPLVLSPILKRWGAPRRQGLCSLANLWATFDSIGRWEAMGTP